MSERRYKFHPLAEKYPLMEGLPFEELVADIRQHGLERPITLYEGMILDGRNRYRACLEAGTEPGFEQYTGDDPAGFVESANDHRRHLTPEQQKYNREQRLARVAELRRQGISTREIAHSVGRSQTQVLRDIKDAGEPPGSPEPGSPAPTVFKVKGKDSKSYPAKKHPGEETREKAAERLARQQNGQAASQGEDEDEAPSQAAPDPSVPERVLPYFAAVPLLERAVRLATRLANLFQEVEQTAAWRVAVAGKKHREHSSFIRAAARNVQDIIPVRPCPECGGKYEPSPDSEPCKGCEGRGYQTHEEVRGDDA